MGKLLKKNMGEILTFFLTIILLLIIFKLVGILDHTILISDLLNEFYPLYTHLSRFLSGEVGIYSFNLGLGDSFLGALYFYMSSPFNLLLLLIKDINLFCIITIILKSAFSSFFCYKYLKYQFKKEKKIYFIIFSLLYALSSYYLSYNMHVEFLDIYMMCPLVLLGIDKIVQEKKYKLFVISFMFVIFLNYYFAYMIVVFSMIYYNYRILMTKIRWKELCKKNIRFIMIIFLACFAMSFVFLPILSEIGSYSRGDTGIFGGEPLKFLFDLQDAVNFYIIGNFVKIDVLNIWDFYIYTSIVTFPLLYFYFINNKFSKREKILTALVFLVLIISISFNYVDYMWHGFTPPFCINGRFTFLFILFILMICTRSIYYLKKFKMFHYYLVFGLVYFSVFSYLLIRYPRIIDIWIFLLFTGLYFATVGLSLYFKDNKKFWKYYLICCPILIGIFLILSFVIKSITLMIVLKIFMVFLCILLIHKLIIIRNISWAYFVKIYLFFILPYSIYLMYKDYLIMGRITVIKLCIACLFVMILKYLPRKKYVKYLFLSLILAEIILNGYEYLYRFSYFVDVDNSYGKVIASIQKNDPSLFYRIEDNYEGVPRDDAILYNYYGIDYFVSVINENFVNFFIDFAVKVPPININIVQFDGSYHLLSSLLNVKYYVETQTSAEPDTINLLTQDYYTKIDHVDRYDIYRNDDYLSFGYMVDTQLKNLNRQGNGLDYTNELYKSMTHNDNNVLEKVELTKNNNHSYSFLNTSDQDIYLLIKYNHEENIVKNEVSVNGDLLRNSSTYNIYIIKNNYALDDWINIQVNISSAKGKKSSISGVYAYYYHHDVYKDDIEILKENQMEVTKIGKNSIEGVITTDHDGLLFLSCLYNDDLDLYVDGVKQDKIKLLNTFIGVDLSKGKHHILLKYKPRILYISVIPSGIGLILLLLYIKRLKKKNN